MPAASAHASACFPGSAPGVWSAGRAPEWHLSSHECAPLRRYVWVDPAKCAKRQPSTVPNAGPSNAPSCVQRDGVLLSADMTNASVLMLGDSTSAQLLWHTCEAFRARPQSLVVINASHGSLKKYTHRLRSLDNHVCQLPLATANETASERPDHFVLGSFSHYGVAGPPYWVFAYPLPPWLSDTSLGMVREDIPRFKRHTLPRHTDPTVVIASSGFWDIASWWAHEGNFSKHWTVPVDVPSPTPTSSGGGGGGGGGSGGSGGSLRQIHGGNYTARYLHGVHRFVREVRRSFPRSVVVWRLMHPGLKHSITPKVVQRFNQAVRQAAPGWRLPLLDVEPMVSSLSKQLQPGLNGPVYGTQDGRHLHPWLNIALLNVILNVAHGVRSAGAAGSRPRRGGAE